MTPGLPEIITEVDNLALAHPGRYNQMLWIAKQSAAILSCRYGLARAFPASQSDRHSIKEQADIKKKKNLAYTQDGSGF